MVKILSEDLEKAAKELYRVSKHSSFHPQVNYDKEDGSVWVDWVCGENSWQKYRSADIIQIPISSIVNFGMDDNTGFIDYKAGIARAIEDELYLDREYLRWIEEEEEADEE